ncbi:MAG: methylated-DNA--[protein]-cysteine S-methyltransferase [Tissierellia bacterium]|nr:methylated-DNA--[protein]-cysteine S-methyltransferase [Tissierellia bacterium]
MSVYVMDSPIGKYVIEVSNGYLRRLKAWKGEENNVDSEDELLIEEVVKQLNEYFDGKRTEFDIPIEIAGTEFQQKVYRALLEIPYGETRSYSDIAIAVGSPKAVRAIGNTNRLNPVGIIVPCHRVIGKNGALVGYAGGLDRKTYLLDLEKKVSNR